MGIEVSALSESFNKLLSTEEFQRRFISANFERKQPLKKFLTARNWEDKPLIYTDGSVNMELLTYLRESDYTNEDLEYYYQLPNNYLSQF
ncbi:hypothetical protein JOC36_001477 [Weissella uvarum]|uniref:hypothetical protein n=1 Tax=Weissella uvarum TaxID=1479233 RepID=UPI00196021E0|nr:hypothetical protein [Weissella uvarum]MBM7617884.1 hypothetical protein [Weissella uvarum]MCM0596118.1 hypothetical protein [Weissella uvarum]